jgi:transcriptional regulator with XRE-family HTH domain
MKKSRFAEHLQRLMTERDMTQSDLARQVWGEMVDERGYTVARNRQALTRYLNGEMEPRMSTKRKMAEALGVPVAELDPLDDPTLRPGSGIYTEPAGQGMTKLEVSMTAATETVRQVVVLLAPYST